MGISGLLPALKQIQNTKHLSEFAGKTVAVDAYVWLHRALYTCAADLATGKPTKRYIEYAIGRVRILKHHGIQPYIVFDGGPLPAKNGTEEERKQKRDEYLAKGNALAALGKSTAARDCYIKCVDVTPQIAYQFIKALQAENVSYVVAPYEADAQMAYLERVGLVDAILTEDSDLLVFGCKTVLFKFDANTATVVCIQRQDFGSVTASAKDGTNITLAGFSDVEFRAMAILSGCDYLPSIPGVGLKTANSLLRKWRTAEQAIRAVTLEGKKSVPPGYLKNFQLAEKCFLHQRVYCPLAERLVHLTPIDDSWTQEFDAYVGSDLDPFLARAIARGDTCPIKLSAMVDINPSPSKSPKARGKQRENAPPTSISKTGKNKTGGIYSFFGPNPVIPQRTKSTSAPIKAVETTTTPNPTLNPRPNLAGKASGKRTLAEVMDQDTAAAKLKKHRKSASPLRPMPKPQYGQAQQSKFFGSGSGGSATHRRHSDIPSVSTSGVVSDARAGPSRFSLGRHYPDDDKENEPEGADEDYAETSEPEADGVEFARSDLSIRAQHGEKRQERKDELDQMDIDEDVMGVEQEEGYMSPAAPDDAHEDPNLSSPLRPARWEEKAEDVVDDDGGDELDVDPISSPISVKKPKKSAAWSAWRYEAPVRWNLGPGAVADDEDDRPDEQILIDPPPSPTKPAKGADAYAKLLDTPSLVRHAGPDLRSMLGRDDADDDEEGWEADGVGSSSPPSASPDTPADTSPRLVEARVVIDVDEWDIDDDSVEQAAEKRTQVVLEGWRERWAMPSAKKTTDKGKPMAKQKTQGKVKAPTSRPLTSSTSWAKPGLRPKSPTRNVRGSPTKATKSGKQVIKKAPAPAQTPIAAALRASALRRSDTNVTPQGRHNLGSSYLPPKTAPSKIGGNGVGLFGGGAVLSTAVAPMTANGLAASASASASRPKRLAFFDAFSSKPSPVPKSAAKHGPASSASAANREIVDLSLDF